MAQLSCVVNSATLRGVAAMPVSVEVVITSGIPSFSIVGMPDVAIQESRERVKAAIKAVGFSMPSDKIVVNLAPGSLRKHGSGFDLPIAMGILVASRQINPSHIENKLIVGELSLTGEVRAVEGVLAYQYCAKEMNYSLLTGTQDESTILFSDEKLFSIHSLSQVRNAELPLYKTQKIIYQNTCCDFSEVRGHEITKRAMQIAAAGNHGIIMVGPPGTGKTMLARCFAGILPPLTEEQQYESSLIHSVVGESILSILSGNRPFRSPHHSCTQAGLLGGGNPVKPGEASLAHNGVLFLDELAEFKSSVLQGLRQPLEEGVIRLTRADGLYEFPANFMLVAATNPCPCGYYGDLNHECHCSETQIRTYQNRIGGPLLDRIDIRVEVWSSTASELIGYKGARKTEELRQEVLRAREFLSWRKNKHAKESADQKNEAKSFIDIEDARWRQKSNKRPKDFSSVVAECCFADKTREFFKSLIETRKLNARSVVKTLLVARTIADLAEQEQVGIEHLSEAFTLRFQGDLIK